MLQAVGIISEYNPFHNGHSYMLNQAKEVTGADVSVALMSGNWLQRGEPAAYDKWQRTKAALLGGVDLVIELPLFSAVQPSHLFAKGAVDLAAQMKCRWLAFGAEHPQMDYQQLIDHQPENPESFKKFDRPYASIFQDYLYDQTGIRLNQPNDILGFGYAKANFDAGKPLQLVPLQRVGSQHDDVQIDHQGAIASASAIRQAIHDDDSGDLERVVPESTLAMIHHDRMMTWDNFWPFLRFELVENPVEKLHQIYQMTEGIEYRLKRAAIKAESFAEFLHLVKTKRYTYTRIQRLCTYVLLHAVSNDMLQTDGYVRLLGFNSKGQHYLNQIKGDLAVPLITKVNDDVVADTIQMDFRGGMLTQMINGQSQDFYRHPIIIE